jgi:hypothetical protein
MAHGLGQIINFKMLKWPFKFWPVTKINSKPFFKKYSLVKILKCTKKKLIKLSHKCSSNGSYQGYYWSGRGSNLEFHISPHLNV